jgi:glycosyltransferase involved in cell wall biosynthesis
LCASRTEGFGLPTLEAMACRCPAVSTRVGGAPDLIEDGRQGFLADVEDSDGLAQRLVQVLRLPESGWRAMSNAAFATATAYTWDDATTLFEAGLREAIGLQGGEPFVAPRRARAVTGGI